jgi:NAD(P)-dependent dehydrogenase (short-subunit alcohol dehydrogenase family)
VRSIEAIGASGSRWAAVEDAAAVDAAFGEIEAGWTGRDPGVNAGTPARRPHRPHGDELNAVIGVNLTGAFHTIRRAVPKMMRAVRPDRQRRRSAPDGQRGQANYSAAKAGLLGLSRSVARELGSRGITCNVVAPGPIVTAMTEAMGGDWLGGVSALVPVGRPGTVEECAAVITFLCSEPAGYVTGALVPVDGGLGMGA